MRELVIFWNKQNCHFNDEILNISFSFGTKKLALIADKVLLSSFYL